MFITILCHKSCFYNTTLATKRLRLKLLGYSFQSLQGAAQSWWGWLIYLFIETLCSSRLIHFKVELPRKDTVELFVFITFFLLLFVEKRGFTVT